MPITANARVAVAKNDGATVSTRRQLDFLEGTGITLTLADDGANERAKLTITATPYTLPDATTVVLGGVLLDQNPSSGSPIVLTTPRLGAASGVCDLDSGGHVPLARLSGIASAQLSGTAGITSAQIASLAATKITGILAQANGGTGLDTSAATNGQVLIGKTSDGSLNLATITAGSGVTITNGPSSIQIAATGTGGTVTSVGLSLPSELSVTGSPVTGAGTLAASWVAESANVVFAGPTTGSAATPGFRSLVAADVPALDTSKLTTGTLALARLSGITTAQLSASAGILGSQLDAAAGITSAQITSLAASKLTGQVDLTAGGTGLDTSAVTDGQVLIGQTSDHTWGRATLTAGANVTITNAGHAITIASSNPGGTVTSVGLSLPADLTVAGSPVSTTGTLSATWANENANVVHAGPTSGGAATPTWRALVAADIPSLPASAIGSGTLALARGGTNADNNSITANQVWAGPTSGGAASAAYRALVAADVPALPASQITSGTLALARLSGIGTAQISASAGILGSQLDAAAAITSAQITSLAASKLTGLLAQVNGGTGLDTSGATDGQVLIGQTSDHSFGLATLTAGANVTITNAGHSISIASSNPGGTVTSVGLSMPAEFSVANSPVTGAATLAVTKATQAANAVYAGPASGSAAAPAFRALTASDTPDMLALTWMEVL